MRRSVIVPALALAAASTLAVAPAATKPPAVKAPKAGRYTGTAGDRKLTLYVSGKRISIVAFQFRCRDTIGNTSLSDIRLKKKRRRYRFTIRAHSIVTFNDPYSLDVNAAIGISGRFGRTGRRVAGRLRVRAPGCPDTKKVRWRARRARPR